MTKIDERSVEIGSVERRATKIWIKSHGVEWVWQVSQRGEPTYIESHDPMDRVGGPYKISDVVTEDFDGDKWFLFAVVDCYFPCNDLVRANSWEDAYSKYIDWASEHRQILIADEDRGDYAIDTDNPTCEFTSDGKPVCTDNVNGSEVVLSRVDFD